MDREEKLVEAIREYTCLWKVNAKEYKDAIAKENAWKEVARKVSKILPKQTREELSVILL